MVNVTGKCWTTALVFCASLSFWCKCACSGTSAEHSRWLGDHVRKHHAPRLRDRLSHQIRSCQGSWRPALRIRGGSSDVQMQQTLAAFDNWDMMTQPDELGMNVTMFQSRSWPYCTIELWWESLGKFRFTYEEQGEDIMCAFPHASTSNMSGWDIDQLAEDIKNNRGMARLPDLPFELGAWRVEANATFVLVTNRFTPDIHLFLTDKGFYFLGSIGYALKAEGIGLPPITVLSVDVCEEVGLKREHQKIAAVEEDYVFPSKEVLDMGYS